MKKLLLFGFFIPISVFGQTKNVVVTTRLFPKADKVPEFEKALKLHVQKFHKNKQKWNRV
jgi:hypothetical protein